MGISRICGCTTDTSPVPDLGEPVRMFSTGCMHGFDGWQSIAEYCGGVEYIALADAVRQCVRALQDAEIMAGSDDWMPHRDLFLFAYCVQADGGTPWAGLQVVSPDDLRIVWDPCPKNLRNHHGSMNALEWARRGRNETATDIDFVVVIPWG